MTVLEQNACNAIIAMAKKDEPDYWTKLEHQYAGMAMQGILMNEKLQIDLHKAFGKNESMDVTISEFAADIAHTLVKKMKEESA